MQNKKIGYLTHTISYGGATISLYLLQKSLKKYSYDKYLLISKMERPELIKLFEQSNKKIISINIPHLRYDQITKTNIFKYFYFLSNAKYYTKELIAFVKQNEIDILHVNSSVFNYLYRSVKNSCNVKIVTHVREYFPKGGLKLYQNAIIRNILYFSDAIITISDNEAYYFQSHPNLIIVPNPFDFEVIQSKITNKKQSKKRTQLRVAMIASLGKSKGQLEFLKSLKYILDNFAIEDVKFSIVGVKNKTFPLWKLLIKKILFRNNFEEKLKKFIIKQRLENYVELVPYSLDIPNILNEVDIVVRPSLSGDPWGRDIIEAMAQKKPIVATGSSDFFIIDGYNGYLVRPKDIKHLSERIYELLTNQRLRETFGLRSYSIVKQKCNLKDYGEKISNIYNSL